MKKILWWSILCILLISDQKWSHPNEEENAIEVTQNKVGNLGETKESKKYGCVCTCCHADDLPRYQCVIFLRNNYTFDIPAVANTLSKRYREIRQKEFICKPHHKQLKDGTYSNNVQNCGNSDLLWWNFIHEQNDQDIVYKTACVHVAIKQIYQDHNVSSSKIQSTTLVMLLCKKHYRTNSQFLLQRSTFAKNVTNIY